MSDRPPTRQTKITGWSGSNPDAAAESWVELDVLAAVDVARLALVRLADVDDARARVGQRAGGLLGADFESLLGHALTR